MGRARAALAGALRVKGHASDDAAAARDHLRDNLRFYDAPAALVCHVPGDAVPGTFLEAGLFLQNVMLGLVARRLGHCPQFSVAGEADTLPEAGHRDPSVIVCALAVGCPEEGTGQPVRPSARRRSDRRFLRAHGGDRPGTGPGVPSTVGSVDRYVVLISVAT